MGNIGIQICYLPDLQWTLLLCQTSTNSIPRWILQLLASRLLGAACTSPAGGVQAPNSL
jgi:hypothetical protein